MTTSDIEERLNDARREAMLEPDVRAPFIVLLNDTMEEIERLRKIEEAAQVAAYHGYIPTTEGMSHVHAMDLLRDALGGFKRGD